MGLYRSDFLNQQECRSELLMERNRMTEEEAHRYIQKYSMDSGTNMVEMAKMVLVTRN